jgi:hypothetical protein
VNMRPVNTIYLYSGNTRELLALELCRFLIHKLLQHPAVLEEGSKGPSLPGPNHGNDPN